MKFFIDTAEVEEIREANEAGIIAGVTTNPSLIAKSGRPFVDVLKEILEIVNGPVSAEVLSEDAEGMVAEGEPLAALSETDRDQGSHDLGRDESGSSFFTKRDPDQRYSRFLSQPSASGGTGRSYIC